MRENNMLIFTVKHSGWNLQTRWCT